MKRFLSIMLAWALCLCLAAPALAEGEMDERLSEVTLAVKNTLDVSDDYTSFSGDSSSYLRSCWYLYWSGDNGSLDVTAADDGQVLSVYAYRDEDDSYRFYGFDPALPAGDAASKSAAQSWLDRLVTGDESAVITGDSQTLGMSRYYSGVIYMNGLPTPVTFTIQLFEDLTVQNFWRSDCGTPYVGELPGAQAQTAQDAATPLLRAAVKTELFYVDDGRGEARLVYVPTGAYTVVDALTGEAVDMDALYASFGGIGAEVSFKSTMEMDTAAAEEMGRGAALTEVELSSISNYADVLSQDTLDTALRAVTALGLDGDFALKRCAYSMDGKTGDITAVLRYTKTMTEDALYGYSYDQFLEYSQWDDMTISKYVTVNAKTGELENLYTNYPLWTRDESADMSANDLRAAADSFLQEVSAHYADTAPCTLSGYNDGDAFVRARQVNGYFYPANTLSVTVNAATGVVDSYDVAWDEDVRFASAEGIVSQTDAQDAYAAALTPTLGYVAWPQGVSYEDSVYSSYIDAGYAWVESLRLAWYYDGKADISGVDALTGEVNAVVTEGAFTYDDVDGIPQQAAIEALGVLGVGYSGGKFQPRAALTQRAAAKLLLEAAGYAADDWDDDALGDQAASMGFIAKAGWAPDAVMTRTGFLKALLGASRYASACELIGVWSVGYADADAIDAAELSYAAAAQALGLVTESSLRPNDPCTRAAAAQILYNFMSR